jgi:hypothetical protein
LNPAGLGSVRAELDEVSLVISFDLLDTVTDATGSIQSRSFRRLSEQAQLALHLGGGDSQSTELLEVSV